MDIEKIKLPASVSSGFNLTPTPGTPNYKPLDNSSDSTPLLSPDLSPDPEVQYENMNSSGQFLIFDETKSFSPEKMYENLKCKSPTYENVKTTISITYRSPVKNKADNIYEDIELNPERAVVPTTVAELPEQEASQSRISAENRPQELDLSNQITEEFLKSCDDDSNGFKSTTYKSLSLSSTPLSPTDIENSKKSLISPTEISMTERSSESSSNSSSISPQTSPQKKSSPLRSSSSPSFENLLSSMANFGSSIDNVSPDRSPISRSPSNDSPILRHIPFLGQQSPLLIGTSPVLDSGALGDSIMRHEQILRHESPILVNQSTADSSFEHNLVRGSPVLKQDGPILRYESPILDESTKPSLSPENMNISPENSINFERSPIRSQETSQSSKFLSQDNSNSSKFDVKSPVSSQSSLLNNIAQIDSPNSSSNSLEAIHRTSDSSKSTDDSSLGLKMSNNDKRKSCDDEILDQNAIYQQVKYFRRSVHEINSLLEQEQAQKFEPQEQSKEQKFTSEEQIFEHKTDENKFFEPHLINFEQKLNIFENLQSTVEHNQNLEQNQMDSIENFDSLEAENVHLYENVPKNKDLDAIKTRMHENEPKKLEISLEEVQILPLCSKCGTDTENSVKKLTNKFEMCTKESENENKIEIKGKIYDKDGLPPCLRAKNAKNNVKTKSLDENAFVTEFGRSNPILQRRKSLDDRTSSYINSKMLIEPKNSPETRSTNDVSQIEPKIECPITEQKLNRERIEKYKEERRNFLREKYRSESFREDNKEKILSRLKQKSKAEKEDLKFLSRDFKSKIEFSKSEEASISDEKRKSPLADRKCRAVKDLPGKVSDESCDFSGKEEEFLRHRRGDSESEKKRHTYELLREREFDSETRRSLEARTPR